MSDASGEIRITDLAKPLLSDVQRAALAYGERRAVDLSVSAVLGAAVERTGLEDFGPDDFRLRLALWLEEIDADPNRTGLGRLSIFNACVRYASNRLLLHDLLGRHPEIADVEIRRPIIVVGLPRSGTTHLLNLISADRRLRSLPLWESYEPLPRPGEEAGPDGVDPRRARCDAEWRQMQAVTPHVVAMHPMHPDHVHEEIELQLPDFSSYTLEWTARVPRWRDYYLAHDQTPHYAYMRRVLQVLQWQRPRERWILKSPQHFEQLGPLLATFPDATVVMTHRDPVSVIQSAATMMTYAARMSYRSTDPDFYMDYWIDRIERLLRAAVRDLHLVGDERRIDVPFHELMADDVGMVERIFRFADHPMTPQARLEIEAYMGSHPRGRHGRVVYDLRADFGVEPKEVRRRFDFYFERFPVREEVS